MAISNRSVLCAYRYDPLDRLADCAPAGQGSARFFYQKNRLATQIQGQIQHSLLRTDEHLLAQRRTENNQSDCALLATDQQHSVIAAQGLAFAYTPYGHHQPSTGPMNLPGFTGERVDPLTGHYLLGSGYRAFNPVLMRFNSPDSLSPFGEGGVNAYAYCEGDPVNRVDTSGHLPKFLLKFFKKRSGVKKPLLHRSVSEDSVSSVMNSMPSQATTSLDSGALGEYASISKTATNPPVGAPPPRPPKNSQTSGDRPPLPPRHGQVGNFPPVAPPKSKPPPLPPRSVQAGNFPSSLPPQKIYVSIEGKKMEIREAFEQLNRWIPKT
ncbi:Rhs family protein [Pseudomonas avellanae]|uniref:Rhs family protein n=2 Tax=Pseudomonas syringae group TaxID=136849 RepID=A0A261WJP5_9PSED|nr:RHS repeat-associated core domain-containing protein [Pseudomonas syringae]ATV15809.1 Rhs family protein [Pseudomonas syringae pv. actinidiae]OZI86398.1 Rhs family protein [Pseudomonas avellanae]PIN63070.1 Rhs family protein [Pseudomonas syringae pv. actinidiae]